jgi:hypothetical protein
MTHEFPLPARCLFHLVPFWPVFRVCTECKTDDVVGTSWIHVNRLDRLGANIVKFVWMRRGEG